MTFDELHHTWTHEEYTHGDDEDYLAQVEAYEARQKENAPALQAEAF